MSKRTEEYLGLIESNPIALIGINAGLREAVHLPRARVLDQRSQYEKRKDPFPRA